MEIKKIKEISCLLRNTSKVKFILISILTCLLYSILIATLLNYFTPKSLEINFLEGKGLMYIFFLTVIIAPVLETLIYQFAIIEIVFKIKIKQATLVAILISSFLFSLSHIYSIYYMLATFSLGVVFATTYIIAKKKKRYQSFLVHIFYTFFK